MDILINAIEARVLGSLVEKDITTPDYYPLSLNALVNACNQKNNRDPLMNLSEEQAREALSGLQQQGLAGPASGADSRVPKYEHRIQEVFNFTRAETAIMCVLLLRGPQTPGELRGRSERMFRFEELSDVQSTLQRLIQREPALVKSLSRQPGTKEARYAHLLSGDMDAGTLPVIASSESQSECAGTDRVAQLQHELREVRDELADLRQQFAEFRKQFE